MSNNTIKSDEVDLSANTYMRRGGGTLWSDAQVGTIVEQPARRTIAGDRAITGITQRLADAIVQKMKNDWRGQ